MVCSSDRLTAACGWEMGVEGGMGGWRAGQSIIFKKVKNITSIQIYGRIYVKVVFKS